MKKLLTLLLFFSIPILLWGQNSNKLNLLLEELEIDNEYMGEVLVMKGNEALLHKHLGFSNMDKETVLDESSTFSIGGITKIFTATLVMMAVEEGKLDLGTTLDNYFPKLPNSNNITIRHLLQHRSGLHDHSEHLKAYQNPSIGIPLTSLINPLENTTAAFAPGTRHDYLNTNYIILTHILEKTYGKDYQTLLEEKITKPNGLDNTFLIAVSSAKLRSKSQGHIVNGEQHEILQSEHPMFTAGAGGINSTASDLSRFSRALLREYLIKGRLYQEMQPTASNNNYGMGITRRSILGKAAVGHTGKTPGFQADWLYFPQDDVTMVFLMNRKADDFGQMVENLVGAYFNLSSSPVVPEAETFAPAETAAPVPKTSPNAGKSEAKQVSGTYALTPKLKLTIFEQNGELKAQATNQVVNTLVKKSPLNYVIKGTEGHITFVMEDDVVTHLIFEQSGYKQKADKE